MSTYYKIIYFGGNRDVLSIAEFSVTTAHEEDDYYIASSKTFCYEDDAKDYCRQLAAKHGKRVSLGDDFPLLD